MLIDLVEWNGDKHRLNDLIDINHIRVRYGFNTTDMQSKCELEFYGDRNILMQIEDLLLNKIGDKLISIILDNVIVCSAKYKDVFIMGETTNIEVLLEDTGRITNEKAINNNIFLNYYVSIKNGGCV